MSISSNFPTTLPSIVLDFANTNSILDPRISFSRGTNATYYDGVSTAYTGGVNLVTYSGTYTNAAWTIVGGSVTANATTAPDGTTTAYQFTEDNTTNTHRFYQGWSCTAGVTYTVSCYLKYIGRRYIQFNCNNQVTSGARVIFDIQNGLVSDMSSGVSNAYVYAISNGWYRCVCTFTATASTGTSPIESNGTATGSSETPSGLNGAAFYFWGYQVEIGTLGNYTPTTSATVAQPTYQIRLVQAQPNTPRFDHDPVTGNSLGILTESTSSNLIIDSERLGNYVLGSCTVWPNTIIAPDGAPTATTVYWTATGGNLYRNTPSKSASALAYTYSVYAKAGTNSSLVIHLSDDSTGECSGIYNISTGTAAVYGPGNWSNVSTGIQTIGGGWYRCWITGTSPATGSLLPYVSSNSTGNQYLWGFQLEQSTIMTSYIATEGTAATRNGDLIALTGSNFSSWYNTQQGTFYCAGVRNGIDVANSQSMFGTNVNYSDMPLGPTNANFRFGVGSGVDTNLNPYSYTNIKIAASFAPNGNHYLAINGGSGAITGSNTNTYVLPTSTALYIGWGNGGNGGTSYGGNFPWNGTIRKFAFYPETLTTAQLSALVT